ncbi:hypothetical protein ACFE04_015229 [Oxalis oulophora]
MASSSSSSISRRLRAFKRWMKSQHIDYSPNLDLINIPDQGIAVKALTDLKVGDVVATIPKNACLTIKTSSACNIIESAQLDGYLGLSVALMYERSLATLSPWAGYLQLLPERECLPMVWTLDQVDHFLRGTELHKTIKEDKGHIFEDWKENILPLIESLPSNIDPNFFGVEQYFAAKSLIASRSFEIDDYHGFGMVPLADLFNHKTADEDVHFTSTPYHNESDSDADNSDEDSETSQDNSNEDSSPTNAADENSRDSVDKNSSKDHELDHATYSGNDPNMLEMILVKDVKLGAEVFNTYGIMGNAALLHRYGFTEPNNPFSIVNIDLDLVLEWSLSLFSNRFSRARFSLWRKMDYSGFVSENSEYFEISFNGEPEIELLILLNILFLSEETYSKLDLSLSTTHQHNGNIGKILLDKEMSKFEGASKISKDFLMTENVCNALLSLADMRENLYGSNSIEDDVEALKSCSMKDRKLYHSLMLRVSEREILKKMRAYATTGMRSLHSTEHMRKRLKDNGF